ncbi:MAG: DUF3570 domain-containing protein [Polyangiaceae bacterium]
MKRQSTPKRRAQPGARVAGPALQRLAFLAIPIACCASPATGRADGAPPDVVVRGEVSAYADNDYTEVLTPAVTGSLESPTGGWGLTASFLVDVVSSASADIVASASPRWTELRYAPALSVHHPIADADVAVHGALSHEPDYLSLSLGGSVAMDILRKSVTPSIGYTYSHDTVGRAETPFDVFSRVVQHHAIDLSASFVIDKATMVIGSGTLVVESGDGSKPYRAIPMFDPAAVGRAYAGMGAAAVDRLRTDDRPLEQLPTERERWALEGRLLHRFARSTLRLGERLYTDSWGLWATTTDARWLIDVGPSVRLGPHLRLHEQTGVDFWRLAYTAVPGPDGVVLPALRTGDRELGPLVAATTGFGFGLQLTRGLRATLEGDTVFTQFLDHLYILQRAGVLTTATLEASIE